MVKEKIIGYCLKCGGKVEMIDVNTNKEGSEIRKEGRCKECGNKIVKLKITINDN